MKTKRPSDSGKLSEILTDIFYFVVDQIPDFDWDVRRQPQWVVDNVVWCAPDEQDELTELATTLHPFIVEAIVRGGRKKNRYQVTLR